MSELYPGIRNHLRAKLNVGSSGVEHTHHLPRHAEDVEPASEETAAVPEERSVLSEKEVSRFKLFLSSALRGIRGGEYGSAET